MSANFTSGPWVLGASSDDGQTIAIDAPKGDPNLGHIRWKGLADVYGCDDQPEIGAYVARANAQLIAAAPCLLDAAQLALKIAESWIYDQLDGTASLDSALRNLDPVRAAIAKAIGDAK